VILAAAAHAEDPKNPPPRELVWYWRTAEYGLPYAGGWMKQPAGLLDRMTYAGRVYQAVREYREHGSEAGKAAQWRKDHPEMVKLLDLVRELRKHDRAQTANHR